MMFLGIAGVCCLIYYLICAAYAGFASSYLWIWLAGGLLCLAGAFFLSYEKKHQLDLIPAGVKIVVTVLLVLVVVLFVLVEGCIFSGMVAKNVENLDYVIVLGAQVKDDGPSRSLYQRIQKAYEYMLENPNTIGILSGGQGDDEPQSEAACMEQELLNLGIAKERLLLEDQSTNTDENFRFSARLIPAQAIVGVISSNFHVFRAVRIGRKQMGNQIYGIPAPSSDVMQLHYLVREFLAIIKDSLTGHMKW